MNKYIFVTPERLVYKPNYDSPEPDFIDLQAVGFDPEQTIEDVLEDLLELNKQPDEENLADACTLDLGNESRQYFPLKDYKDKRQMAS